MNISELRSFLDSLTGFFEKKHPSDKTVELWFDTANGIPSAEIRQIYQRITRECESWPRNLPATMWAIHYDIIANLHTAEKTYKYCDAGCNEGLFHMRKKNELGFYGQHCVFRCDTCKQRTEGGFPWGNKHMLIRQGHESLPIMEGAENIKSIRELKAFILVKFGESERAPGRVSP
ncbi:MAG TPA: hypothetical protein VJZ49_15470 [Syntrophales bacterium]|nr:hypothetical protein [Syntrophales bacterium]